MSVHRQLSIAALLAETLSADETLDAVAEAAAAALDGSFAAVFMPNGSELRLVGECRLPDALRELFADGLPRGALSTCAEHGQTVAVRDLASDDRFDRVWRKPAKGRYSSLLAVPIGTDRSGAWGLVVVFFADGRDFSDDDLELGQNLVHAARAALERSALVERERHARALSQELARIGGLLATELEPERVVSELARQTPALVEADACAIHVVSGDELVIRAIEEGASPEALGAHVPLTTTFAGEVVDSRAPVAVMDIAADDPRREANPVLEVGYRAYLGVPLSALNSGLVGVLSVYSLEPREWREEEVETLLAVAASASIALSNAELYQEVALEKERSETILASVADGIVAVDRDDRVLLWNTAAERITGVPRGEAVGRTSADVLRRSLAAADGEPAGNRIVPIPRAGDNVWLSVTEAVMRDAAGEVAGRIFTFRDVSAERLVEQVKSEFVLTVSHQLRAPLTSIYGFAETLLRNDVLFGEEERRTFLRYVVTESERLAAIVDTLLDVARLDAGDLEVETVPTDVHSVVDESIEAIRQAQPGNGYELVVDLPAEPLSAEADREKLRQVLGNLLDNAVKFSPQGGKVTISARRMGDRGTVEIEVADEGMGIPHAEQQLIFSKFVRRQDLVQQEGVGAGLGLFIARGLVSAMGGDIRVSSVEGQGAAFVFELPLAAEAAE